MVRQYKKDPLLGLFFWNIEKLLVIWYYLIMSKQKLIRKKPGPKPFRPNWTQIDKMCKLHCTGEEIADMLEVDYDTLVSACKRDKKKQFSDYIRQKGANGKMSLRRTQYTAAMDGNIPMLIWLGKNWLGQKDKSDDEIDALKDNSINITITNAEDAVIEK